MGACCTKKHQQARKIGGNQQAGKDSKELIAEAAEKRMEAANRRGLSQQGAVQMELKQQKKEDADRYEREQGRGDYVLRYKQ